MNTHIARPILIGAAALVVLVTAGWAANTWPEVKHIATGIAIAVLAGMCSIGGITAVLLALLGNQASEPPEQPQATAHASDTRGAR
ncbi:hypothetical protein [Pseudonocardia humida]|uniref:Uncharacterized protein n=1 Tax=Pseudonocardia humida TaxID=2800819 RepID=A0ABT1A3J1_9PSEU|nr:hypothetical protein [Pseudonocardia humida]MCO1657434.1 hypothetical protein [Pseudonocardia humida]